MKKLERRTLFCAIILIAFALGMIYFLGVYAVNADSWFIQRYNRHLYTSEGKVLSGTIVDCNDTVLSYVENGERLFSTDVNIRRATLHVVGDAEGKIGTSALSTLADYFVTYQALSGANSITEEGNRCTLTIDAELCKTAYAAMNGLTGTVCIYNYKTGAIVCLVSTPTYDPLNPPSDLESNSDYEGAYLNRFFSSTFTPGSTMKSVTLMAALSQMPEIAEETFTCEGSTTVGNNEVTCSSKHGTMTLKQAFAKSCNGSFATIATRLGGETLMNAVRKAGLTTSYSIGSIHTAKGSFELATVGEYQLGWAGVGLYHDLVNPCSLLIYYGALANGGTAAIPTYVKDIRDTSGDVVYRPSLSMSKELCEPAISETIKEYLINNVAVTYDASRFPDVTIGAKSGTIEQKTGLSNCWFAGFVDEESSPYAFVVYLENAGSGNKVAGSVAAACLHKLLGEDAN